MMCDACLCRFLEADKYIECEATGEEEQEEEEEGFEQDERPRR